MSVEIEVGEDNIPTVKEAINRAILKGLETIGIFAQGIAYNLCPKDTGYLSRSITHKVVSGEKAVYIGTNVDYAPYVELGTGIYYSGGRRTPWFYVDAKGTGHFTHGSKPRPFLKPAAEGYADEYNRIMEEALWNG